MLNILSIIFFFKKAGGKDLKRKGIGDHRPYTSGLKAIQETCSEEDTLQVVGLHGWSGTG